MFRTLALTALRGCCSGVPVAMEKTSGIWTQKMLMRLERKMVNIMDHENKEVVERFPAHFVREPTAFTSNDPKVGTGA